jgi:hypothetical protein
MIWLTWRQVRSGALVAVIALLVVAVVAAVTGPHLIHLYDSMVAPCRATGTSCANATNALLDSDRELAGWLGVLVVAVPGLIGVFWGAPLVARELEHGTYRLVLTQSVTRGRWLGTKLALGALASMAAAGLFSLVVTWWSSPLDRANLAPFGSFDKRDIVPIGYAAFAFVLGVTGGLLLRRALPAMAATLAAFVAVRLAVGNWLRPHFATPLRTTTPDSLIFSTVNNPKVGPAGAWVLSTSTIDGAGHVVGRNGEFGNLQITVGSRGVDVHGVGSCSNLVPRAVGTTPPSRADASALIQRCIHQLRLRDVVTYQPSSRYWTFQWYETAIFVGLALLLGGLCFWWIRRRLV